MERNDLEFFSPDDAVTVDLRGPRAAHYRMLLRAVLLLHDRALWEERHDELWKRATGSEKVSTSVLMAAIRASGIKV